MNPSKRSTRILTAAATVLALAAPSGANAAAILFGIVNNTSYVPEGHDLASMLTASGHTVTTRFLNSHALTQTEVDGYDQIWVYDLSTANDLTTTHTSNYNLISSWYNALTDQNLILDGRILSSSDRWTQCATGLGCPTYSMSEEDAWIAKYATELQQRGGGLMLGTDHQPFVTGINNINAAIGVGAFQGNYDSFPFQAVVDPNSPLHIPTLDACGYGTPHATDVCINDNSSTSLVATGLQTNGQTLTPVAWHGTTIPTLGSPGAAVAVSTTMGSSTFGTCGNAGQPPCDVPEPAPLAMLALGLVGWLRFRGRCAIA